MWLGFVPCLNLVWQFVNVVQVGNSLRAEYRDRGMRCSHESCGKSLGLSYIILGLVVTAVNYGGQAAVRGGGEKGVVLLFTGVLGILSLFQLILWIVYWVKIAGFTSELKSSSRRSLYVDDQSDRRSWYDDDRGSNRPRDDSADDRY